MQLNYSRSGHTRQLSSLPTIRHMQCPTHYTQLVKSLEKIVAHNILDPKYNDRLRAVAIFLRDSRATLVRDLRLPAAN